MAAGFVLSVFCFFCVVIDAAFSRRRNADGEKAMRVENVFGIKSHVAGKNISTAFAAETSDYMLRLLRKVSKPAGKVDVDAIRGNLIYGFTADDGGFSDRSFKFNVTIRRKNVLRFAELQLYKQPCTLDANLNSTVTLHITDIHTGKGLSSQRVSMETIGWIGFTLPLDIIRRWDRNPASNAGLAVQISESNMSSWVRFATKQTNSTLQPLLVVYCSDSGPSFHEAINMSSRVNPPRRSPRSVYKRPSHKGACRRHKLNVHIKDLGWDKWVIAPKMYSAYYCAGTCHDPGVSKLKTNHARIQLFLSQQDSDITDAPCCVPNHLSSISMLFYGRPGESTYLLRKMNDFVVQTCACR